MVYPFQWILGHFHGLHHWNEIFEKKNKKSSNYHLALKTKEKKKKKEILVNRTKTLQDHQIQFTNKDLFGKMVNNSINPTLPKAALFKKEKAPKKLIYKCCKIHMYIFQWTGGHNYTVIHVYTWSWHHACQ